MHQILLLLPVLILFSCTPSSKNPIKPRIIISTDIGGTDPDDNQSMTHMLMYSDMFEIEGLVSSPSYGDGSKAEILRMIDLYEKDLPQLKKTSKWIPHSGLFAIHHEAGKKRRRSIQGIHDCY
jgi:hypothetical protein